MIKTLLNRALFAFAFVCAVGASASANIVLDLDVKEGNQGVITKQVQPGDIVEVELIAQQGAQDIAGFEVVVQFDSQKFMFKSYQKGGLMASAIDLPVSDAQGGKRVSAGFLGGKSAHDSGSLGMLIFEVTQDLGEGGVIMLSQGSFGKNNSVEEFALSSQVTLQGQQGQQTSGFANQQGTGSQNPQGQQGTGFHNPHGQGQQGTGFHNPHGQGQQGQGQHGQGQGQGQQGQGQHGQGQGQQGQGQHGQGQGQQGGGFQNPQDPMGNMGHNQGMPQDPMQMIKHLPSQLQPAYIATHKAHLQSRLTELNSIQQTLGLTQRYLAIANEQEKQIIGRVLRGFYHQMQHPDPNQPPTPPPSNVNDLLFAMFQNVNQEIQHITQELQSIR